MKKIFENIASQEKENIDCKLLSREITKPFKGSFSFFQKHDNLHNSAENSATNLYLYLLENPRTTVFDLFLNTPTDKYNKEIYLQAQKMFSLKEDIFKKLTNKTILNDSDQSNIMEPKYKESLAKKKKKAKSKLELKPKFEESIAGTTKLRKQRLNEIAKKRKDDRKQFFYRIL